MDLSLDLFSDIEPTESENDKETEQTSFFTSDDLFAGIELGESENKELEDMSDLDLFEDLEAEEESDNFDEDDLFNIILGESGKKSEDINPNTSVLYAVPGVNYGKPDDFPEITQIKERFLSELMSDF